MDHTTEAGPDPNYADINMSLGYFMGNIDAVGNGFFKTKFPNLTGQTTIYIVFCIMGLCTRRSSAGQS